MQDSRPPNTRIGYLDGLRGWASFVVLLSHLVHRFLALSTPQLRFGPERLAADIAHHDYWDIGCGILVRIFSDGHLAVLIFFVLSGYALSASHLNLARRNLALATASRYFRLMIPILVTSLIAFALLRAGLFFNVAAATTLENSSGWLGTFYRFDANLGDVLRFALYDVFFHYDERTTYNSSLWTMPIEITGSILVYAYLGIFRTTEKIHWRVVAVALLALVAASPIYACFIAGYLIAELKRKSSNPGSPAVPKYADPLLLAAFAFALLLSAYYRDSDRITFCLATVIVLCVSFSTRLGAFFSNGLSEWLGTISFPLYLIQIPIVCSWSSWLFIELPLRGFSRLDSNWINLVSSIALCLVAATLLVPVEKFSMKYAKRIGGFLLSSSQPASTVAAPTHQVR